MQDPLELVYPLLDAADRYYLSSFEVAAGQRYSAGHQEPGDHSATLSDNVFSPSWPDGCSSPFDSGASPSFQANRVSKISGCGKVG